MLPANRRRDEVANVPDSRIRRSEIYSIETNEKNQGRYDSRYVVKDSPIPMTVPYSFFVSSALAKDKTERSETQRNEIPRRVIIFKK